METALIVTVIILASVIICILVLLGILFYNQMLVTNEVNKRLLLLSENAIDKERATQQELQQALIELDRTIQERETTNNEDSDQTNIEDEPFNPHDASENYRED